MLIISDIVCECVCTARSHKPSCAQGDQLSNRANPNTLQWGTLKENLYKLERDIHEKGTP